MAHSKSTIIMNDTPCDISWCQGPAAAWKSMTTAGTIEVKQVVSTDKFRGYSIGVFSKRPSTDELATPPADWPVDTQVQMTSTNVTQPQSVANATMQAPHN